jgi:hypothetical protein
MAREVRIAMTAITAKSSITGKPFSLKKVGTLPGWESISLIFQILLQFNKNPWAILALL